MKAVLHHVWSVTPQDSFIVYLRRACENPSHVRPPAAVARRVRVSFAVSVRVVYAVCDDPIDGAAFKGQRPAER